MKRLLALAHYPTGTDGNLKLNLRGVFSMMMVDNKLEAPGQDQTSMAGIEVRGTAPRGFQLEAREFEGMLQRAFEVLSKREPMAA